jgi:LacI family transcriptional regulator
MARRRRANDVLESLRARIEKELYEGGSPLPPERELAEECGVSRVTLRRALRLLVEEGAIERRPGVGNFVVDRTHRVASGSRSVGLLVQQIDNPYFATLARHMAAMLSSHGLNLIVAGTDQDPKNERACLARMAREGVAGLVLSLPPETRAGETARALAGTGIPVVMLGDDREGLPHDLVRIDDRAGIELALDHLTGLGHTRIGYIMAVAHKRGEKRKDLVRDSLARRGLGTGHIVEVDAPDFEGGKAGIDRILSRRSRPTAILTTNDITALGALQRAVERGIDVPGELSILGYDDIPMAAMATVPLTTVSNPTDEIAALAVERLLARMNPGSGRRVEVLLEPKLVVRASTASLSSTSLKNGNRAKTPRAAKRGA